MDGPRWNALSLIVLASILITSCGSPMPGDTASSTAAGVSTASLQEDALTMVANLATSRAQAATLSPVASSTVAPSLTSTRVSPTPRPPTATPGPFTLADDLTRLTDRWSGCDFCVWGTNGLEMGPFPASMANLPQILYCETCGQVANYQMAVDATFGEGPSERGYGFIVKETDKYLLTAEITPWQTVDVWKLDFVKRRWERLKTTWSGFVRPGNLTNRLEVSITPTSPGKVLLTVKVNGRTPFVVETFDEVGWVGLYLYGHGTSVTFDNFTFEELEPYGLRIID
jgi:hypothetical protein